MDIACGFQLAQLVKSLVVEQETWVQIPPTPKTNWCLGLMVKATIMKKKIINTWGGAGAKSKLLVLLVS